MFKLSVAIDIFVVALCVFCSLLLLYFSNATKDISDKVAAFVFGWATMSLAIIYINVQKEGK